MGKNIVYSGINAFAKVMADAQAAMLKAASTAVNKTAFTARKNAIENIEKNFTLRNNFTTKNIYTQPSSRPQSFVDIRAYTGALEPAGYMERQEFGGKRTNPTGANLVIPNTRARGNNNKKKVQTRYYLGVVSRNTVHWSRRSGSRKARLVATAFVAANEKKFIRMNNAFFQVSNFRKTKKSASFRLREILNLKHASTRTPAQPWLSPASEYAAKLTPEFYAQEMDKI